LKDFKKINIRKNWVSGEHCNEECVLFRESLCETERTDEMCDREFTPQGRLDAEECNMYYSRKKKE